MKTVVKKKLDIFNLFYSGAAVVILIGVIAKLLEWPAQDILITAGLTIEAIVFGVSAVKFVDVVEKQEVATEATLSKVAEGLGTIAANAKATGLDGETYINIQTGDGTSVNSNEVDADGKKISIDINGDLQKNAAHSLWQLEQMDILSLAKDLFFQPAWDKLSADDYAQISQIFKRIFEKKLPNKEALPFLIQFPVKLPVPEMSKLVLEKSHSLNSSEVELLCKAFSILKYNITKNFLLKDISIHKKGFIP